MKRRLSINRLREYIDTAFKVIDKKTGKVDIERLLATPINEWKHLIKN